MGVGAAIAKGSHVEKGYWALFVKSVPKIRSAKTKGNLASTKLLEKNSPLSKTRKPPSPIRFVKIVVAPPF